MATVNVTKGGFEKLIDGNKLVFLDFWASWCGPCRMFGPVFEKASEKHADAVFGKVDTEAEQELSAEFGIRSIPTLAVFKEGVLVYEQPGALPPDALEELITKVRELDMEEVRKKIAEQEKSGAHAH